GMGGVSTSHARLSRTKSRRSLPPAVTPVSAISSPLSMIRRTRILKGPNSAYAISRHPVYRHARLTHRTPHRRRDAAVEVVDTVNGRVSQIDVDDDRAPHLRLRHDVLALATLGNADDPASRRRRDVAAASERLDGRRSLETG